MSFGASVVKMGFNGRSVGMHRTPSSSFNAMNGPLFIAGGPSRVRVRARCVWYRQLQSPPSL